MRASDLLPLIDIRHVDARAHDIRYRRAGLYERRNATGGDETIDLRAFNTRYLLLSATAGPSTTVALREFEILRYSAGTSGGSITPPTPTVPAPPSSPGNSCSHST